MSDAFVHGGDGAAQRRRPGQHGGILLDVNVLVAEFIATRLQTQSTHSIRHEHNPCISTPISSQFIVFLPSCSGLD